MILWCQVKAAEQKTKPLAFKASSNFKVNWGCLRTCMLRVWWTWMYTVIQLIWVDVWLIQPSSKLIQLSSKIKREGQVSWRRHQNQKSAKSQPHAPGELLSSNLLRQFVCHNAEAETGNGPHCTFGMAHLDGPAVGTFCSRSTSCPPTATQGEFWATFCLCMLSPWRHRPFPTKKLLWIHCLN